MSINSMQYDTMMKLDSCKLYKKNLPWKNYFLFDDKFETKIRIRWLQCHFIALFISDLIFMNHYLFSKQSVEK